MSITLRQAIENRIANLVVLGLGYVGLPVPFRCHQMTHCNLHK